MSLLLLFNSLLSGASANPEMIIKAVLTFKGKVPGGQLVEGVAIAWFEILRRIDVDQNAAYAIDPRRWEEIIAGAYDCAGFDVILTPHSGDLGRDVIATKNGVGSICIFDQVKAYKPGNVVTAEEVRAMLGTITGAGNVSKGVISTTSTFAPGVERDPFLKGLMPYRLELRPRDVLLPWLKELAEKNNPDDEDV